MKFSVLGSGSRGNSVYVESGQTAILIDGGFSGKELAKRLQSIGRDIANVNVICVTHEHNDHISGVGVISRRFSIPVLANVGTFRAGEKRLGTLHKRIEFETGSSVDFDDFKIRSFSISHDTADPVGFVISDDKHSLGYCTDVGKVSTLMTTRLIGCNGLILEFNHNPAMLKNGPYPLALQQRVRSSQGHLSNEDGAAFLSKMLNNQLRTVVLAHLSDTNNTPQLARAEAEKILTNNEKHFQPELLVASQDKPTPLIQL